MGDLFSSESVAEYIAFAQRHSIMCFVFVAVFGALVYTQIRIMLARVKKIAITLATVTVNRENGVFVDVRTAELFAKGHIAGSLNIGLEDIRSGNTSRIMKYQDKPVILVGKDKYDADCFNSAVSLKKQGFTKVFTMEGGISQWAMDNLPLSLKD